MPIKKLRPNFSFTQDRIEQLKAVVPEAFADGKINFDSLREALGEYLEDQGHPEAEHGSTELAEVFGLFWPGKREARRLATLPSKGTLVPAPGEGIDEDKTCNIFIEGENLEVLKLLQKSYAGRIKMIYIDPPYNTGNDFVYKDDFRAPLEEYLKRTGQADENGKLLTTNTKADGRFHSNWLNMLYPRLYLARTLLRDDGVVFVSIDENEIHHLKLIMNEIFGNENLIGVFVWQAKKGGGSDNAGVVNDHEYVVCFAKAADEDSLSRITVESESLDKLDKKGAYRRGRELNKWGSNSRREDRPTMYFPIPGPNGKDVYPIRNDGTEGRWRWGKQKMFEIVERGDVEYVERADGTFTVYEKIRSEDPRSKPYRTWLTDVGATADGSKTVKEIFYGKKVYNFPKPVDLIKRLLEMGTTGNDDLILDFFAGSCTTAHAVIELNHSDEGDRQFICVQLPETSADQSEAHKAGYETIAEIGKERIRRVIAKMKKESNGKSLSKHETSEDLGFKVFKLARSNFKAWQDYDGESIQELETLFDQAETPLVKGWKEENLLTEIMLQQGFTLDSKIARQSGFKSNKVQLIESEACSHRLFVCLDPKIKEDTIKHLELRTEDIFVCLDSAITDQAKMRLADICRLDII